MPLLPILLVHVCAATVGLLSGYLAMVLRKGSGPHNAAGTVFTVSMLTMSSSGAWIATFVHPIALNVLVATLTFYMVATAWRTARNRTGAVTRVDYAALLFVCCVALSGMVWGAEAAMSAGGKKDTIPAGLYFFFGTVALLFAVSDVRNIRRGGATGPHRIARHLWRMCLALLIATFSLYPGQARMFPPAWRQTNLLWVPHVLLIGSMLLHRFRVMRQKRVRAASVAPAAVERAAA